VALPAGDPLARGDCIDVAGLHGQRWIAGPGSAAAGGAGASTGPGARVLPVRGGPQEQRRLLAARTPDRPQEQRRLLPARTPGPTTEAAARPAPALREAAPAPGQQVTPD
jgi:hypothetical protein